MYVRLIIGLSFPSFPYAMAGWMAGCGTHALSLLFRPLCLPSANSWLCTLVMFEMTALCAERFDLRSAANPRGSRPLVLHITRSLGPRGATEGGRVVFAFFFFSRPAYWKGLGEDLPVARNLMAPVHAAPGLMMGPYPSPLPTNPFARSHPHGGSLFLPPCRLSKKKNRSSISGGWFAWEQQLLQLGKWPCEGKMVFPPRNWFCFIKPPLLQLQAIGRQVQARAVT